MPLTLEDIQAEKQRRALLYQIQGEKQRRMAAGRVQSPGVVAPTNPPPPSNPYEPAPAVAQSSAVSPDYAKVDTGFGPKYAEPVARGIVNAATTIPFTDIGRLGDKVYGPRKPWQSAGAEFAGEFVGAAGPYSLASKGLQTIATGIKGIRGLYTATKLAEDATTAQKAAHLGIETAKAAGRGALFGGVGEGLGQAADAAGRAYSGHEGQVDYTEPLKQAGFFAGVDAALTLLPPALRGLGGAIRGHLKSGNVAAAEELASKIPDSEAAQKIKALFSNWNMENRRIPRVGDAPEPMMPNVSRETPKPTAQEVTTQPASAVGAEPGAGVKPPAPVSEAAPVSPAKQPTVAPKDVGPESSLLYQIQSDKFSGGGERVKSIDIARRTDDPNFVESIAPKRRASSKGWYSHLDDASPIITRPMLRDLEERAAALKAQGYTEEAAQLKVMAFNLKRKLVPSVSEPPVSPQGAAKQPWEMTKGEFEKTSESFHGSDRPIYEFTTTKPTKTTLGGLAPYGVSFGDLRTATRYAKDFHPTSPTITPARIGSAKTADMTAIEFERLQSTVGKIDRGEPLTESQDIGLEVLLRDKFGIKYDPNVHPINAIKSAGYKILRKAAGRGGAEAEVLVLDPTIIKTHRQIVSDAIASGKPVPPEVLADYPDLVAQGAKPPKHGPSDVIAQSAVGGALGFQEKKDEQGNVIGYEYDPVKGLLGMTGGMAMGMAVNRRGKSPKVETPPENPTPGDINLNRINLTEPERVAAKVRVNQLKPSLEKMKGTKLTNDEVIEAAKEVKMSAEVVARSETLKRSAQILNARKNEAELLRKENVTPSELRKILETVRQVESVKTDLGREMQKLSINVDPELQSTRSALMTKLAKSDIDLGAIEAKAAEYAKQGKSLDDPRNVMEFYREFIKPKASEILDEYRYINMLSSPNTHIVNATSNLIQGFILRPGTRLAAGGIDAVGSKLTGRERTYYTRQVPSYYKGMLNSLPAAIQGVRDVMTGKALTLRPDLQYLPTNSKWTKWGYPVTRALEASDIFVRTLVEGGEKEALAYKAKRTGKEINPEAIDAEAKQTAAEVVFRGELDPSNATGQGLIKSKVFDAPASMLNRLRQLSPPFKWLVPFVQTPLNIAKQGFEYSPLGFAEFGVKDKTAQLAKASIGSTVFVGAGYIALNNGSTWAVPSGKKAKDEFYAAGMKPYSLKIGDTWVSYSKLGPLAYPIALAAALKYHFKDSPSALSDTFSDKVAAGLAEMAQFFSDQSYVQSIGNIIDATKGATTGEWKGEVSQLIGGTGRQLIPLAALQGWVNGIIDPIYRKSEKDLTPEAILQNMQKNVIGLSTNLEPYKDRKDQLSRRALPVGNALSPFQVSPVDSTGAAQFDKASKERQSETLIRKLKEAQKENDTTEVKRLNDIRAKAGIPAPEPTKPRLPKLPRVGPISQADIDSIPAHIQVKYEGVKSKSGEKVQMTGPARQVLKDLYAEQELYTKILESLV